MCAGSSRGRCSCCRTTCERRRTSSARRTSTTTGLACRRSETSREQRIGAALAIAHGLRRERLARLGQWGAREVDHRPASAVEGPTRVGKAAPEDVRAQLLARHRLAALGTQALDMRAVLDGNSPNLAEPGLHPGAIGESKADRHHCLAANGFGGTGKSAHFGGSGFSHGAEYLLKIASASTKENSTDTVSLRPSYRARVAQDKALKKHLGTRFKAARERAQLSQLDVATLFEVTKSTVSGWEIGKNYPDLEVFVRLLRIYKVTADEILHGTRALSPRAFDIATRLDAIEDARLKRWAFANCESTVVNAEENLSAQTPAPDEATESAAVPPNPRLAQDS